MSFYTQEFQDFFKQCKTISGPCTCDSENHHMHTGTTCYETGDGFYGYVCYECKSQWTMYYPASK